MPFIGFRPVYPPKPPESVLYHCLQKLYLRAIKALLFVDGKATSGSNYSGGTRKAHRTNQGMLYYLIDHVVSNNLRKIPHGTCISVVLAEISRRGTTVYPRLRRILFGWGIQRRTADGEGSRGCGRGVVLRIVRRIGIDPRRCRSIEWSSKAICSVGGFVEARI